MGNCDAEIDNEVNCVIDQILREDRLESLGLHQCSDAYDADCEETSKECKNVNCAIENSARFSIRILEALRAVQRRKTSQNRPSCTMEEIVLYIRNHYHHDGDLCSQVETALNQVTAQGFVLRTGSNRYHLTGPFACSVHQTSAIRRCKNRTRCTPARSSRSSRRRSTNAPVAHSTLRDSDLQDLSGDLPSLQERVSMDRISEASNDPQLPEIQNLSNPAEVSVHNPQPMEEDETISIVDEVNAGPVEGVRDDDERGRVAGDHSSDENMFRHEPVNASMRRSRCRSRVSRSSSRSSSDVAIFNNSGRSRSRRGSRNRGSDADVSEDSDDNERRSGVRPWVRRCQNRQNCRRPNRSARRCPSSVCD